MRSVVVKSYGEPQAVLDVTELPTPEPSVGEVRVKLILSPVHTHDLEMVRGEYGHQPALPMVPGTEAVGEVVALGQGVKGLRVGQRVAVAGATATWAEYFLARASSVVPLPDRLSDEAGCQLLAMPLSATMLVEDLGLKAGDWMIQNTANGAIGRIVNVLAKRRGFHVINLVRSASAAATVRSVFEHVVSTDQPGWKEQVARITGGAFLGHAVDSLGGDAANDLMSVLSDGGTLVSFGSMNSLVLNLHVEHLLYRHGTVRGFWAARRGAELAPSERARLIVEVIDMVLAGELRLTVDAAYDIAEARKAALAVAEPNRSGKVAIRGAAR